MRRYLHFLSCGTSVYTNFRNTRMSSVIQEIVDSHSLSLLGEESTPEDYEQWLTYFASGEVDLALMTKFSAEINSLAEYLKQKRVDGVVLYATQTPEAQFAKDAIKVFLSFYAKEKMEKTVVEVGELQTLTEGSGKEFWLVDRSIPITNPKNSGNVKQGVVSFVEQLYNDLTITTTALNDWSIYINATGGFKAMVQIAAMLGAVKGAKVYYQFEEMGPHIVMPFPQLQLAPVPEAWKELLGYLEKEEAIAVEGGIPLVEHFTSERSLLAIETLVDMQLVGYQKKGGKEIIEVTALGKVFLKIFKSEGVY